MISVCCVSVRAQSTDQVLVLPNLHVEESQFAKQEDWPSVGVVDLTKIISSLNNTAAPNGAIVGNFNAGKSSLGTEGAILFSMSEDYAMLQDGEYKNKFPESEHGKVRSLFLIGVGKIPSIIIDLLESYTTKNAANADDYNFLKSQVDNNQGMYVVVVDDNKVVHFFKDTNANTKYLDGNWHTFAIYSFKAGTSRQQRTADGLTIVVDGQEVAKREIAFFSSDNTTVFFDITQDVNLVQNVNDGETIIKDKNRRLTHSLLGACMVKGRYVMPTKSNLMLDNVGIFVGESAISGLFGSSTSITNVNKMIALSTTMEQGSNFFATYTPTTGGFIMNFNEQLDKRWVITPSADAGNPTILGSILNGSKVLWTDLDDNATAYACDCSASETGLTHLQKTLMKLRCPERYPDYVMVVAHRGYHRDVPEHSLPSVQRIVDLIGNGVDMAELDVRFTKDNVAVLTHDLYLDRLSNGTGSIEEKNWSEIQPLFLRDYEGNATSYHYVKLEDAFTILKDHIHILLDIKTSGELRKQRLLECLALADSKGMINQVVAGGGSWSLTKMKQEYDPYFGKFLYIPSADGTDINRRDVQQYLREYFLANHAPLAGIRYKTATDIALTPFNYIEYVKTYGVRPIIFGRWPDFLEGNNRDGHDVIDVDPSTDERGNFDFLVEHGATIITTDRPLLLIDYLKAIGRH